MVLGVAIGVLGLLAAFTPPGWSIEEAFGLELLFRARGPAMPPDEVAIVALNRQSAAELGLPDQLRNWPRRYHARLIDRLTEAGAALIAFDVSFHEAGDPADDEALAEAIGRARRVVLFEYTRASQQDLAVGGDAVPVELAIEQSRLPLPAFAEAALATAPFPLPKLPARVSRFWAFKPGIDYRPTLPAVALQVLAMPAMPAWLERLEQRAGAAPPFDPPAINGAHALGRAMTGLRRWVQAGPWQVAAAAPDPGEGREERLVRALDRLYAGPDSRYLNFYGPPAHVRTLSFAALAGEDGAEAAAGLAGKAVFVGQLELEGQERDDDFLTVVTTADGINLSGVEIAATAFANLLDGRALKLPSPGVSWSILLLFGLLIGLIATLLPVWLALPAALLLAAGYGVGALVLFTQQQLWLPLATPIGLQLPLGVLAGLLIQHREMVQARRNLSSAVSHYLPARVTTRLAETPFDPALANETIYGACVVTDAQGFTSVSERLKPEELKPLLDAYLECLFEPAKRYDGIVTDVVGDGMTCVWTAKQPDRACRLNLVRAALRIRQRTNDFNRAHQPLSLPTRMGLHAGPLVIGNVGGAGHLRYTIVGDVVNTAARLEQLNKQLGTFILATEEAVLGLEDEVIVRPLGAFRLVGKNEPVRIGELIGLADGHRDRDWLRRFAAALAAFRAGDWQPAHDAFQAFLERHPDDGPSRFYVDLAEAYLDGGNSPTDPEVIELQRK
jgi:adenylate cyclase